LAIAYLYWGSGLIQKKKKDELCVSLECFPYNMNQKGGWHFFRTRLRFIMLTEDGKKKNLNIFDDDTNGNIKFYMMVKLYISLTF
jgi:hypothetical protein